MAPDIAPYDCGFRCRNFFISCDALPLRNGTDFGGNAATPGAHETPNTFASIYSPLIQPAAALVLDCRWTLAKRSRIACRISKRDPSQVCFLFKREKTIAANIPVNANMPANIAAASGAPSIRSARPKAIGPRACPVKNEKA